MVTVAQLAEHLTVDHEVAGSSPVGHPRTVEVILEGITSIRFIQSILFKIRRRIKL